MLFTHNRKNPSIPTLFNNTHQNYNVWILNIKNMQLKKTKYTAVSLFSGCGGSDLGLVSAGIRPIWANEINSTACEMYKKLTGFSHMVNADIALIDKFPEADILVGCYPCQGYSQGGRRKNTDEINFLYRHFDRALRAIRPRAFIVENVNGMRFSQNQHLLSNQIYRFRMAGYNVSWQVLDAKHYGLAQDRKRLFIVGIQSSENKRYCFPFPSYGTPESPFKTLRDVIYPYRNSPKGSYNEEDFHWYYLSRNRRREWNEQSPCIVANWRHVGLHPDSPPLHRAGPDKWVFATEGKARRFSYLECAALQGFPEPKKFDGPWQVRDKFKAIGNAVPPPLFHAISKNLIALIEN